VFGLIRCLFNAAEIHAHAGTRGMICKNVFEQKMATACIKNEIWKYEKP